MRHLPRAALVLVALLAALVAPRAAASQSALDAAEAQPFLGTWSTTLESPEGPMPITLALTDASGKVAFQVDFGDLGDVPVTDVTRSGDALLARFSIDYQGTPVPVELRLTPAGEALSASWDFAGGAFTLVTTATKR